jgi:hypothetical protein
MVICSQKDALSRPNWATDKVDGPESKSVTIGKPICIVGYNMEGCQDCFGLHAKLSSCLWAHMSGRVGLLTGQRVFRWTGPLVRDGREPSR